MRTSFDFNRFYDYKCPNLLCESESILAKSDTQYLCITCGFKIGIEKFKSMTSKEVRKEKDKLQYWVKKRATIANKKKRLNEAMRIQQKEIEFNRMKMQNK